MCLKQKFKKVVGNPDLWIKLKELSLKYDRFSNYSWHHHKYYKVSNNNDGYQPQELTVKGNKLLEIPYKRELFNLSKGRFSLSKIPIAYFSNEFSTACCETIELFRLNNKLTFEKDLMPYFQGKFNPTPERMGYPISVKIKNDSLILDLFDSKSILIKYINSNFGNDYFSSVIMSRSKKSYKYSRIISEIAYSKGFDGILFKSVRVEGDWIHQDKNLVLFNNDKVIKD